MVRRFSFGSIACHRVSATYLEVCERADGIADHDTRVIEDFLEFRCGFSAVMCSQKGFTPHVDWIKRPEVPVYAAALHAQFIGSGDL